MSWRSRKKNNGIFVPFIFSEGIFLTSKPRRSLDFTGPERCSGKKNMQLKSGRNTSEGEKVVPSEIFFKDFASLISNLLLFLQILRTTMFGSASQWLLPYIKEKRILSVRHLEILAVAQTQVSIFKYTHYLSLNVYCLFVQREFKCV